MGACIGMKFVSSSRLTGKNLLSVTTFAFLQGFRRLGKASALAVCQNCGMRPGSRGHQRWIAPISVLLAQVPQSTYYMPPAQYTAGSLLLVSSALLYTLSIFHSFSIGPLGLQEGLLEGVSYRGTPRKAYQSPTLARCAWCELLHRALLSLMNFQKRELSKYLFLFS